MMELRSKLRLKRVPQELTEFACALVDQSEFEDRLTVPIVHHYQDGVELIWRHFNNTLRIRITETGWYQFSMEIRGHGEVLKGNTHSGRELVQQLRNMLFWLWDDPW